MIQPQLLHIIRCMESVFQPHVCRSGTCHLTERTCGRCSSAGVECLPRLRNLGLTPAPQKVRGGGTPYPPSIPEVEAGRSQIQGHPWLSTHQVYSLRFMSPCLKNKQAKEPQRVETFARAHDPSSNNQGCSLGPGLPAKLTGRNEQSGGAEQGSPHSEECASKN